MIEPQELSLQKVDAMFGFVGFTLGRVKLFWYKNGIFLGIAWPSEKTDAQRSGVEEAFVFADDGVVAHTGEVIADAALESVFGDHRLRERPHCFGVSLVVTEEFPQQSCRPFVWL